MISAASPSTSPSLSSTLTLNILNAHRRRQILVTSAFSPRRRPPPRRRRHHRLNPDPTTTAATSTSPYSDENSINLSIDLDSVSGRLSSNLHRFLSTAADAFEDLRTSVRIDDGHHVVFSCRRSSVMFLAELLVYSVVVVVVVRGLVNLGFCRRRWGAGEGKAVVRRDRSLGGREVVVATSRRRESERGGKNTRVLGSPLSNLEGIGKEIGGNLGGKRVVGTDELPEWWTKSVSKSVGLGGDEMLKGEADRLVRAILDNRLHGKDYKDDDIIQLRQICKISGARVSFGTANARDAFYRASVNFVLNICSRVMQPADTIQINGEDARQFICGLADNIGLEDIRAARILRAAVAAKTRSCFLQSWSFEVQGKRFEALKELSKICQIFQIFPPEEYSPEMEMVASGLKKTIGIEQRKHLLTLFKEACGANCQKTAEEALGIVYSNGYEGGDNESNYANSELL